MGTSKWISPNKTISIFRLFVLRVIALRVLLRVVAVLMVIRSTFFFWFVSLHFLCLHFFHYTTYIYLCFLIVKVSSTNFILQIFDLQSFLFCLPAELSQTKDILDQLLPIVSVTISPSSQLHPIQFYHTSYVIEPTAVKLFLVIFPYIWRLPHKNSVIMMSPLFGYIH